MKALGMISWSRQKQKPKRVNDVARSEESQQIVDQPRRSGREQIPPRKHEDYEFYVNVEDEEEYMLATCKANTDNQVEVEGDDGMLEVVVHYIMVHYGEKEMLKNKRRNTSPRLENIALMPDFVDLGTEERQLLLKSYSS